MRRAPLLLLLLLAPLACRTEPPLEMRLPAPDYPPGLGLALLRDYETVRASSSDPSGGNADARRIEPGEEIELARFEGPGCITHLWFTIAMNEEAYLKKLVLRAWWDGEASPSIEAPIGDFFGLGHGGDKRTFYSSAFFAVAPQLGLNCFLPMPFAESARLTVRNEGKTRCNAFYFYVDAARMGAFPEETGYLHAQYRQRFPCKLGEDYVFAEAGGRGHLLGVHLAVEQTAHGWWGEGDDRILVDGNEAGALLGTGTEDYFCGAWNFRAVFSSPYLGSPRLEEEKRGCRHAVYRFHATDPIPFRSSLRYACEHGHGNDRSDNWSSVAFWYQTEPHLPFPPLPPAEERLFGAVPPPFVEPTPEGGAVIEGESLLPGARATAGGIAEQTLVGPPGRNWSGEGHLWWTPARSGERLTLPFQVPTAGTYDLAAYFTLSDDYGKAAVHLDEGVVLPSWDGHSRNLIRSEKVSLGRRDLAAGRHALVVEVVGKNERSTGYMFGLDCLVLSPASPEPRR
jgi:D-arabinan exo alpha-(1,3)/(1,5)-arabinofuranosidase (non-reducing end)